MGLFEKLRAELVDIVEWVDDSRHTLVWRFPRYHNQIKYGARLIVRPGQQAIFVHQGRVADVFDPGHYRLETKNLPILSTIQGWKYGFDSPFKSEVYFVNTRPVTDLKWGTPNPVITRDADFGTVRLRAFGNYTLRANEPRTLLTELVGADAVLETDEITELIRSVINSAFADLVGRSNIAVVDFAANYAELAESLRREVVTRIDDEYGLEIPQLFIVNISLPSEVEKALDAKTSINAIGDMAIYQAYQAGSAMPVAAANPAGGIAGAGLGVGMGMAMAGPMMGAAAAAPPTAAPPPLPGVWHVGENGRPVGPFAVQQLAELAAAGRLTRDSLVWSGGMSEWVAAGRVPQLASLFGSAPPPLPGS
jgi:membrane protease subunit (stomatin/prohibitin family)